MGLSKRDTDAIFGCLGAIALILIIIAIAFAVNYVLAIGIIAIAQGLFHVEWTITWFYIWRVMLALFVLEILFKQAQSDNSNKS